MRRAIILLVVFGFVELIRPLGSSGYGSQALLAFGFLILAAYTVGEIAHAIHAPAIVGYLAAGVIFGPVGLQSVSNNALTQLEPVSGLAIALIAFLAGSELRWDQLREEWVGLLKIMGTELALSAVGLGTVLYLASNYIPFLHGRPTSEIIAVTLLFASVAIVHSPAVTIALLSETRAKGPVARTTLGVVLLADIVVVLLFTAAMASARTFAPTAGMADTSFIRIGWEIIGALIVGAILGAGIALYLRFVAEELFLFAIVATFLGAEIARIAHVEVLLTLITAGFVTENFSRRPHSKALRDAMERSAAPVFVVFFALAGAKIDVATVVVLLPVLVPLALVRVGAIWGDTHLGARWARAPETERRYVWMGLVSQSGVAIGLAMIIAETFPTFGGSLRSLLLALIALNETVGAILFRRALVATGEVPANPGGVSEPTHVSVIASDEPLQG